MTKEIASKANQSFPAAFWTANAVELLERAAFYGMFIFLTIYLTDLVGFSDIESGIIAAFFSSGLYLLPTFAGAFSDKLGFRKSLLLAFALLTIGYAGMGFLNDKMSTIASLIVLMVGGSFIKSIVAGTVAKVSNESNRARAYSIFYLMVNIGSFTGKLIAKPIQATIGIEWINVYSAGMTAAALIVVFFMFKNVDVAGEAKKLSETWKSLVSILRQPRLMLLIIIVAGFWLIQQQLYASMPKYVIRMIGADASPSWYANVNPLMVFVFVVLITKLMAKRKAITSMTLGMFLMPVSAMLMSLGTFFQGSMGDSISIFGLFAMHPVSLLMVIGISVQGIAECFISPRYLEFFSLQSPKGEEGLYLGFSHLDSFFANFAGFFISGYLLDMFCPNPNKPEFVGMTKAQLAPYYANAHYIWYVFAFIGLISAISLLIYAKYYNKRGLNQ